MESGIYRIRNVVNEKMYIGQSINVEKRLQTHLKELQSGEHANYILQKDFDNYKEENFVFEKIHTCEEEFLNPMEKYFIEKYNTTYNGYNIKNGNSAVKSKYKNKSLKEKLLEKFNSFSSIDIEIENTRLQSWKAMKDIEYGIVDIYCNNDNYKIMNEDGLTIDYILQEIDERTAAIEKEINNEIIKMVQEYKDIIYIDIKEFPYAVMWGDTKDKYFIEFEYKNLFNKCPEKEDKQIYINLIGK